MWRTYAEFLASHGYIVAAPTFISDGSLPQVFHDPASPFAASASPAEVQDAYAVLNGESKVVPSFYRLLFGVDLSGGLRPSPTLTLLPLRPSPAAWRAPPR